MTSLPFDAVQQVTRTRLMAAIKRVESLRNDLSEHESMQAKVAYMRPLVQEAFSSNSTLYRYVQQANSVELFVLSLVVLLDQCENVFAGSEELSDQNERMAKMVDILTATERFYEPIGGLLGYYEAVLRLLLERGDEPLPSLYPPPVTDLKSKTAECWTYCYEGMRRLGEAAEVYPVGGVGDRLRLVDEVTGEPLPVARMIFCGRPLLEWLFRDLLAHEYWYYRVFKQEVSLPVVLMTSTEKNNDDMIFRMGEEAKWYGKSRSRIRRVVQSLVPLVTEDGQWACVGPLELLVKPGGHGVIWKLARDAGVFSWLQGVNVSSLLVRQINNPFGGLDHTLASLLGRGLAENKLFGFAACERHAGFAEGLLVLSKKDGETSITNIEYTKFASLHKQYSGLFENAIFPANTNILFASIKGITDALLQLPIPGIVVNAKTQIQVQDGPLTMKRTAARLESTMQNITDVIVDRIPETSSQSLSTFINLYDRLKLISVTKKPWQAGQNPIETPEYCFYDWYRTSRVLLQEYCGFSLPENFAIDEFLVSGPNMVFFFNPALGPFWEVIGQKIFGGELASGSELELDIAEVFSRNVCVDGSFRLLATESLGSIDHDGVCHFSENVGRAYLNNVRIENEGLKKGSLSDHIKRTCGRHSSCTIRLLGSAELVAENVNIRGQFDLTVADGFRATLLQGSADSIDVSYEPCHRPSWNYHIEWKRGHAPHLAMSNPILE